MPNRMANERKPAGNAVKKCTRCAAWGQFGGECGQEVHPVRCMGAVRRGMRSRSAPGALHGGSSTRNAVKKCTRCAAWGRLGADCGQEVHPVRYMGAVRRGMRSRSAPGALHGGGSARIAVKKCTRCATWGQFGGECGQEVHPVRCMGAARRGLRSRSAPGALHGGSSAGNAVKKCTRCATWGRLGAE